MNYMRLLFRRRFPFPQLLRNTTMNAGNSSLFQYTKAVVCGVPSSLPAEAQRLSEPSEPVDFDKALRQHVEYNNALRKLGLEVIELPADNDHPDCVFVEDSAVVCDGVALITHMGHPTRRGETPRMLTTLREKVGLKVVQMKEPATLDGGDVLFTGKEFFVGLSSRTNQQGLETLAKTFPTYPVSGIPVSDHLHLKSMMTMADPDLILVGGSDAATTAWKELENKAKYKYNNLLVPEVIAANCLYINGTLVHLASSEIPNSVDLLLQLPGPKIALENSEFTKVDGCLTCLSILI